ncbi:unnamed protein product, partial [Pylaiella littoralis]
TSPAKTRKAGGGGDKAGAGDNATDAPPSTIRRAETSTAAMKPVDANSGPSEVAGMAPFKGDGNEREAGCSNLRMQMSTPPRHRRRSTTPATTGMAALITSRYKTAPAQAEAGVSGDGVEGPGVGLQRATMASQNTLVTTASADAAVPATASLRRRGSTGSISSVRSLSLPRA